MAQARAAQGEGAATSAPAPAASTLQPGVQDLVRYIDDEAKGALTSTVAAQITAHGIETPLGILTLGPIEKGATILTEWYDLFQDTKARRRDEEMTRLSGEFCTAIPHRLGRSRWPVASAGGS